MHNVEHFLHLAGHSIWHHHQKSITSAAGAAGTAALAFAKTTLLPAAITAAPYVAAGTAVVAVGYGGYKVVKWLLN